MVADKQTETWQVKNILMKDFYWQVKCDVFVITKWPSSHILQKILSI